MLYRKFFHFLYSLSYKTFVNPLVSVIVPVFNDEKYIFETLQSICSQTYSKLEIIVIDDCSADKSIQVVEDFKDKRIRLVRNESNKGAAYSRNVGISLANGDYVAFLDGDDIWKKEKIEKQVKFMEEHNYLFSCTGYELIDEDSKPLNKKVFAPKKMNHKTLLRSNFIGCLTVVYKRNIYPDLRIPDEIYKRNDYALWLKLSERCDCYYFDEVLAQYRKRKKSISSDKKNKVFKSHIVLFKKLYNYSSCRSFWYSIRNVAYYYLRRIKYIK